MASAFITAPLATAVKADARTVPGRTMNARISLGGADFALAERCLR